jgi:hypothetical protein
MKKILFAIISLFTLNGCYTVQVIYTEQKSNSLKIEKNNFTFENDTIKIIYSFWAEGGVMAFIIENKLDIPIYIDWKKSSFINSKFKLNYYSDNEITKSKGSSEYSTYLYSGAYNWSNWYPTTYGTSSSTSIIYKPERITFIPPHSITQKSSYNIFPKNNIVDMSDVKTTNLDNSNDKGKVFSYSMNNTILSFSNFITYSTKESFDVEKYVSNEFYVSKVIQISKSHIDRYISSQRFYTRDIVHEK